MPSNFSALGFNVDDLDGLSRLVKQVMALAEPIPRPDGGATYIYGTASKASVAIHTDAGGTVVCVEPFLVANDKLLARYQGVLGNRDCAHYGVVVADFGTNGHAERLGFVTPHVLAWADALEAGMPIELGIAGICETLSYVDDTSAPGISPLGLQTDPPDPRITATGMIVAHFMRHNELDHRSFEWAQLQCGPLTLEIVADPTVLPGPFQVGQMASGTFRLTGPIWNAG